MRLNRMIYRRSVAAAVLFAGVFCCVATAAAQQQMSDFSLSGFGDKGKKNWDLKGRSADMEGEVVRLNDVVSNLYNDSETVKLTAAKGDYNRSAGQLRLEKNVVVSTSSGATMLTDSLDWNRKEQIVSTDDPVSIRQQDMVVVAQGATGHTALNKVDLKKDVQMQIDQADIGVAPSGRERGEKKKVVITCDGPLSIDYAKNTATFNNRVTVTTIDAVIESDVMDVYFASKGEAAAEKPSAGPALTATQIKTMVCRGNVKITQGENVSYSEEAVYSAADRKITLSGQPKLVVVTTEDMGNAPFGN